MVTILHSLKTSLASHSKFSFSLHVLLSLLLSTATATQPVNTWTSQFLGVIFRDNSHSFTKTCYLSRSSVLNSCSIAPVKLSIHQQVFFLPLQKHPLSLLPSLSSLDYYIDLHFFHSIHSMLDSLTSLSFHRNFLEKAQSCEKLPVWLFYYICT